MTICWSDLQISSHCGTLLSVALIQHVASWGTTLWFWEMVVLKDQGDNYNGS